MTAIVGTDGDRTAGHVTVAAACSRLDTMRRRSN
jgi:hypothetical protein